MLDDRQEAWVMGRAEGRGADIALTTRTNLEAVTALMVKLMPQKRSPQPRGSDQGPNTLASSGAVRIPHYLDQHSRDCKPAVGSENPSYKSLGIVAHRTSGLGRVNLTRP